MNRNRPSDCPDPIVWYEIAGGELADEPTQQFIRHATDCEHCGRLLCDAVSDLNVETTSAEAKQIAELESARPEWQDRLARRIAQTLAPETKQEAAWWRWWTAPRLAMAAAGLLAAALVGYGYESQRSPEKQVAQLLAEAGSARRFSELRFEGSRYASLGEGLKREPASTFLSSPGELLKAEALIYDQLAWHPSDAFWLRAKARADLLDGKYDAAQATLRRAWQLDPKSPEILTDLATAYFQQKDYAAAYETLSRVLALRPDDPLALFNRAIVSENQFLYRQALDDWDRYLQVDPNSQWAAEARERSEAVRKKLEKHAQSQAPPLLSPAQLAEPRDHAERSMRVDERIEEYLNEAVVSWLPQAYPEKAGKADRAAQQALFFLADLTSRQHNDRWLSDLLRGSSSPKFPAAVAALSRAIQTNESGEYAAATEQSVRADQLFRASGNMAGALRAHFEKIFAEQIERQSETCRREASASLRVSERYSYPWLQIQLGLESAVCSSLMGDIGADQKATRHALERAQGNGYGALYLRALGFVAGFKSEAGEQSDAWKLASVGLDRYWSGQFPTMRGYNLYTELAYNAEAAGRPSLQVANWREAVALIDSDKDLLLRAWAHSYMANAATEAHQPQIAEQQYANAASLFALAPRTEARRSDALENEIHIAQLEASLGRFDAAIARLTSIQDQVRSLSNNYLVQMFYCTLGELQLRRDRGAEAEQALRPAVALAEQSLASLASEADRMNWSKDAAPVYLALAEAELTQGRSQESLEMYEWYMGASQRGGADVGARGHRPVTNPPVPNPSRLASRLPLLTHETVIAYGLLPGGLAIWVYDDGGVRSQWIPKSNHDLEDLAARFYDLSSDPKSELSALRRDAHSLYESLIAPVEQQLEPGRTLVVEAEGALSQVPFEALLDSNNHYLVERWSVVHSLGQDSDARLRLVGSVSPDSYAVVVGSAASSPADGLVPLPNVAAEADAVASGFHSAIVLKDREATLRAVRSELPAAAVFHFAGHSLATPSKTGLMLIGESRSDPPLLLDADDLRKLPLPNMRLAVLSACSTASSNGGSDGFNSVTEALLRAGVPNVVASRWSVDSVEARAFVEDFYRGALSGQSVSDAIRLTSRKTLANPRTSHPYYWSAFAAYGRP